MNCFLSSIPFCGIPAFRSSVALPSRISNSVNGCVQMPCAYIFVHAFESVENSGLQLTENVDLVSWFLPFILSVQIMQWLWLKVECQINCIYNAHPIGNIRIKWRGRVQLVLKSVRMRQNLVVLDFINKVFSMSFGNRAHSIRSLKRTTVHVAQWPERIEKATFALTKIMCTQLDLLRWLSSSTSRCK